MKWEDYYVPRDFYGDAQIYARNYCKKHPDADSQTAYFAVQEAADLYERSSKLRKVKFRSFVHWKIVNDLYMNRRLQKKMITEELKASIIRDYETGMTAKDIAERYGLHPHTTHNNIVNWAKKGLLELRPSTAQLQNKPVHKPSNKKKEPETAATATGSENTNQNNVTEIIPPEIENVKSINFVEAASILEDYFHDWFGGNMSVVESRASNRDNSVQLVLEDKNGQSYALQFKKLGD